MNISEYKKHWPLALLVVAIVVVILLAYKNNASDTGMSLDFAPATFAGSNCNVGVVSIEGALGMSPATDTVDSLSIAWKITSLAADSRNKAILILMDSPGGSPGAAEEIGKAIEGVSLPNATYVRGDAVSGGYWIASETNYIVAASTSDIGSIGVTSSYIDQTKYDNTNGYAYEKIISGPYKDVGNPDAVLTPEGLAYLQKSTDDLSKLFLGLVQKNRHLTDAQTQKLSDAKFYLASDALQLGLIDKVGGLSDVKEYLASKVGVDPSALTFCEPVRFQDLQTQQGQVGTPPVK